MSLNLFIWTSKTKAYTRNGGEPSINYNFKVNIEVDFCSEFFTGCNTRCELGPFSSQVLEHQPLQDPDPGTWGIQGHCCPVVEGRSLV